MRRIGLVTVLAASVFLTACATKFDRGYTLSEYFATHRTSEVSPQYFRNLEKYVTKEDLKLYDAMKPYYEFYRKKSWRLHLARSASASIPFVGPVIAFGITQKQNAVTIDGTLVHPPVRIELIENRPVNPTVCRLKIIPVKKEGLEVNNGAFSWHDMYRWKIGEEGIKVVDLKEHSPNKLYIYYVKAEPAYAEFKGGGAIAFEGRYVAFFVLEVNGKVSKVWKVVAYGSTTRDFYARGFFGDKINAPADLFAKELRKVFAKACGFEDGGELRKVVENEHGNRLALTIVEKGEEAADKLEEEYHKKLEGKKVAKKENEFEEEGEEF